MNDLTRLLQTLQPTPDGESAVRHRTAVVDAVNADGTVDLDFDGTIVPSVSVLDGAVTGVGQVVQVAAWAGDLLVLGSTRLRDNGSLGVLDYAEKNVDQGFAGNFNITGLAVTVTVPANRLIRVTGYVKISTNAAPAAVILEIQQNGVGINAAPGVTVQANFQQTWIAQDILALAAGAYTFQLTVLAGGTFTTTTRATAARPNFILVEDIGVA